MSIREMIEKTNKKTLTDLPDKSKWRYRSAPVGIQRDRSSLGFDHFGWGCSLPGTSVIKGVIIINYSPEKVAHLEEKIDTFSPLYCFKQ